MCLYSSDFSENAISYQSHIIAHRDNEKYLADNPLFKSFKTVTDVKERFSVWRDTYKLDFTTKGIFEDNIQPYHIGKGKYTIADLKSISADDQQKKYHEFATILRQHNVSGRENACWKQKTARMAMTLMTPERSLEFDSTKKFQ